MWRKPANTADRYQAALHALVRGDKRCARLDPISRGAEDVDATALAVLAGPRAA